MIQMLIYSPVSLSQADVSLLAVHHRRCEVNQRKRIDTCVYIYIYIYIYCGMQLILGERFSLKYLVNDLSAS